MISFEPNPPYGIVLLTTYRCNAACVNCCFGCRPDKGRSMTLDEMKHYIDVCMEAYPASVKKLSLTGGECFLLGEDLDRIVAYAAAKGLTVGLISNGYWGKTYKAASERMEALKARGLKEIGFSVGEDHDHIIPLKNCRNAVVAAARLGYIPELRMEKIPGYRMGAYDKLKEDKAFMRLVDAGKIKLQSWRWRKFNNETIHPRLYASHYRPYDKSQGCNLLFNNIVITPYGDVLACCGIGNSRNPHMRLGNLSKEPVKTLYERAFTDMLKRWIYIKGSQDVLQYVHDNSRISFHNSGNGCDSCIEIFENPKILPFLKEHYWDWCDRIRY